MTAMRTLKLVLLGLILVALVVLALANREPVSLELLPAGMARVMQVSVELPLFIVILISVVVGIVIGYLFEWLREHKHRRRAAEKAREAARLSGEVERLRRRTGKPEDDVLALIGS
jgi:putative membrane protein